MLDQTTRAAILRLREEGHGSRAIAQALGVSRGAVKDVLRAGTAKVLAVVRGEVAEAYGEDILDLYARTNGNLVRVHAELIAKGAELSYPALRAFCRRHGLGYAAPRRRGTTTSRPGARCRTTPRRTRRWSPGGGASVQTVGARVGLFADALLSALPRFTRFECKAFLTEALQYFEGACACCTIDNTHVVVLVGSGRDMVPALEMAAFAERFGSSFGLTPWATRTARRTSSASSITSKTTS